MSAVVVARDEETRILLRGLLRLRHFRILGEAEGSTHGAELVRTHQPGVLVVDASLAEGSTAALIRETRQSAPHTRVVLVGGPGPMAPNAPEADAVLPRPFRIAQFEAALAPAEPRPAEPVKSD
jgi:ActR/RegA family two-component response regulator